MITVQSLCPLQSTGVPVIPHYRRPSLTSLAYKTHKYTDFSRARASSQPRARSLRPWRQLINLLLVATHWSIVITPYAIEELGERHVNVAAADGVMGNTVCSGWLMTSLLDKLKTDVAFS